MSKYSKCNTLLLATLTAVIAGCETDERVVRVATQAADRQALQNKEMVQLNREVAEGTRRLVQSDAASRKEFAVVHQQLQAERGQLGSAWNNLESARRQVAQERLTDSRLGPIIKSCAAAAVCAVTVGFCWCLLVRLRREDSADEQLNELLLCELTNENPILLSPATQAKPADKVAPPTGENDEKRLLPPQ